MLHINGGGKIGNITMDKKQQSVTIVSEVIINGLCRRVAVKSDIGG